MSRSFNLVAALCITVAVWGGWNHFKPLLADPPPITDISVMEIPVEPYEISVGIPIVRPDINDAHIRKVLEQMDYHIWDIEFKAGRTVPTMPGCLDARERLAAINRQADC